MRDPCDSDCMTANDCCGMEECGWCGARSCPDNFRWDDGRGEYYCEECWDEAHEEEEEEEEDDYDTHNDQ